ncbi:hypothetical protein LEP1GSC047_1777 [Leptospira inadai serovar Lyme str. 10]|uniref:Uncharacterized protein n=1 Tax=Leptospira inadai serovar Lyme str. 10 TaxID=1049790 RepID=V6HAZ4_9LEPT|nr:hypothetical protein LEP1GSC047_1777 [Leptospira inadai serovar Lyme str. 10]
MIADSNGIVPSLGTLDGPHKSDFAGLQRYFSAFCFKVSIIGSGSSIYSSRISFLLRGLAKFIRLLI